MFNTVPYNSFPASSELLRKLDEVAKAIDDMPTYTSNDRAFLDKWEVDLPILQEDVNDLNEQKANQITIAQFFNSESSYDVGDLVYYNGLSYRCTNAHEGEWDADDFVPTTIANELDTLKSGLTTKVTFTNVAGTDANYRDVTIPSDNNAVFLIVAGGSITSVSTDSAGNVSDIAFVTISADSTKIDDHTVRIWGGSWYRSYSILKLA